MLLRSIKYIIIRYIQDVVVLLKYKMRYPVRLSSRLTFTRLTHIRMLSSHIYFGVVCLVNSVTLCVLHVMTLYSFLVAACSTFNSFVSDIRKYNVIKSSVCVFMCVFIVVLVGLSA